MEINGDKPISARYLTKPAVITDETIMATLKAVVAENPEHIYVRPADYTMPGEPCLYVHGDVPGCVIGRVLHRLGVPLSDLRDNEGVSAYVLLHGGFGISVEMAYFLDAVQGSQDGGSTWGSALTEAAVANGVTV